MAWVRVESSVARHQKFLQAGPAPSWLWLCGLAYCQEGLTDGFIPVEALPHLGVPKNTSALAERLVKARLWDAVDGGWRVHDYLEHNRSASTVAAIKSDRRQAGRSGGVASGEARREANRKQVAEATTKQLSNPSSATATTTASATAPAMRGGGLHPVGHHKHFACGRVCVPEFLHGEFVQRRWHADATNELDAFYLAVLREWGPDGPRAKDEPGDPVVFWRAQYDGRWPAASLPSAADAKLPDWLRRANALKRAAGQS